MNPNVHRLDFSLGPVLARPKAAQVVSLVILYLLVIILEQVRNILNAITIEEDLRANNLGSLEQDRIAPMAWVQA